MDRLKIEVVYCYMIEEWFTASKCDNCPKYMGNEKCDFLRAEYWIRKFYENWKGRKQ